MRLGQTSGDAYLGWEQLSHNGWVWWALLQKCFLDEIKAEHGQGLQFEG